MRALSQGSRITRELSAVLEGLAWEQFKAAGNPERFRGRVGVLVPAYNEADNIGHVLPGSLIEVCGLETAVLVVDDGSRDGTDEVADAGGAVVARHVINRGGGAALRTGYRLPGRLGGEDRRHARRRRPAPAGGDGAAGRADALPARSRWPTGRACWARPRPGHPPREAGIVFFNRSVSFITRTKVTDCSNGYRAVRADVLPTLVLRQEQFHTSEFMIEAIKRGIPAKEVPVTVVSRLHGHSKKPAVVRYGMGFTNAIVRTWLR